LEIGSRQIHALVGQNGSGKSTLIKILSGYHQPDGGSEIDVNGAELRSGDPQASHDAGLRFVHQDLGLVMTESAIDNLALGVGYDTGRAWRIRWRLERQKAEETFARLGHPLDVSVPVERLSPIERATVAVARALRDWDETNGVLVLDELTAKMTDSDVARTLTLIRRIRELGASVLYVSHRLDEVFEIADGITVLQDGVVQQSGPASSTSKAKIVRLLSGGVTAQRPDRLPTSGDVVLSAHSIKARWLQGVDIELRAGEILGVAGLEGSGRDELAGALFGAIRRGGEVAVCGHTVPEFDPWSAIRSGMGYVPGDRHAAGLILDMNVRENLTLSLLAPYWESALLRRRREQSDVQHWIKRLSIRTSSTEAPIGTLSGGNQQKVVIGKWLKRRPKLLLLDEPTQGVDVGAKQQIHSLIAECAAEGSAVIVCSSDEDELTEICTRVVVVRKGHIRAELAGNQLTREQILQNSIHDYNERKGA
jgi:ribose transport system ATP-binding protein